jgi:hypothetical protein
MTSLNNLRLCRFPNSIFRRILVWFREFLRPLLVSFWRTLNCPAQLNPTS